MILGGLVKLFGDPHQRAVKALLHLVERINALEPSFQALSDSALRAKGEEFRGRVASGESLDALLPEVFAAVRESARRTIGLRHFDVQIIGGIVLHQGKIAEMKTGEGKTLVATLAASLNALTGKGVHVVTVNDYLARRDTQWMGPVYHALGLTVGCLQHEASYIYDPTYSTDNPSLRHLRPVHRREAYQADITYGTNHEFGFDYLRDNMAVDLSQVVQRGLHYAIVDEVDYILIDEARTPLIISGPAQESTQLYYQMARLVPRLKMGEDYTIDEKHRTVSLTEAGITKMERWLNVGNLYEPGNYALTHYIENALRALVFYKRDRDYVVKDGQVVIVDEFTGRLMEGRRWADGLHQAVEAKEGLKVQQETITYATITLQNYFRMYEKLAGMTGTAATEAEEFYKIYKLDVVVIPTHKPMIRQDLPDLVFKTEKAKWEAVVQEIEDLYRKGRPVLVGTTSIENSEKLSAMLQRRGIPHQVLNAKHHEREAQIVAQAGRIGAVTVATNMAGRGTDIILGGNPDGLLAEALRKQGFTLDNAPPDVRERTRAEVLARWKEEHEKVVALGGLHVIGTEKHEARRIDNQLRGRAGRQGDPGSSRFYVSLEDDLLRRFGGERIKTIMNWAGIPENQPIESKMVSKAIENAQIKVEAYNFEIRKYLVEYDDVVNKHRDVIYSERRKILSGADLKANVLAMVEQEIREVCALYLPGKDPEHWNLEALERELRAIFPLPPDLQKDALANMSREEIEGRIWEYAQRLYEAREQAIGPEPMRLLERLVLLRTIDTHWVEHLTAMENLRQGIGLYAYGQRDPLVAFKTEGHQMFQSLLARIRRSVARSIYHYTITLERQPAPGRVPSPSRPNPAQRVQPSPMARVAGNRPREPVAVGQKIGRNDPCPCGSGKKYKKCHGANT
ncbi:Protein translocase subunit SecA [bacterium HR23]|nr:Protein translocase subunit SecA [bacterium HR23]